MPILSPRNKLECARIECVAPSGEQPNRRHPSQGAPHRRQPFKKGNVSRRIGRTKGGLNSKLHAVCDGQGRPLVMLLGELKDWRRIHTRYDRCAHTFMSAICIDATVIFWL